MKVLLTGASGQVGKELQFTCPESFNLISMEKKSLDITRYKDVEKALDKHEPDVVINAAAYTSVDDSELKNKTLAYKVNSDAVENIANACNKKNIRFVHFSTDYVFDGEKGSPYTITDKPNPINVYGRSKLQGEQAALLNNKDNTLIIRTSWVYSRHGNNFLNTMINLMKTKNTISVITDQTGTPTWARSIANATWCFLNKPNINGIYHFSDNGETNWFEFATMIRKLALKNKVIDKETDIIPIESRDYASKAQRPKYSVLDCERTWELLQSKNQDWMIVLERMFDSYEN